ncbi:MAG: precorrin-6Y C5,15-methyltransferase (decarboxylating) subunit CbiT, partial [Anaerotignaceae bacterium]
LFDKDFKREKVPMTKQEVRWVTLGYMDIQPNDVVYDIGTGTGAMTIEMAKRCYDGEVYGVEINEEAYLLTKKNVEELGIFNAILHFGEASCTIESFPKPDKVFIGGSKNNLKNIVSIVLDKNPNVKITVNAISLETLTETISLFKELDFKYTVSCINSANSKLLGDYNLMMANNPVYIISTF